jgi:hypothetical protein
MFTVLILRTTRVSGQEFDRLTILETAVVGVVGRDSVVGIATHWWVDVPGIDSRLGRDFPHPSRPASGPTQPPA